MIKIKIMGFNFTEQPYVDFMNYFCLHNVCIHL